MTRHDPVLTSATGAAPSATVAHWNNVLAPRVLRFRHVLCGGLTRHTEAVFPLLPVERGQRILDVCCGFGDTAIRLANATGPKGEVLGVDCCQAFLAHGWHKAELEWVPNVRFRCRDIERGLDEPPFDLAFSRFGTTVFADPVAGLQAIRATLKPGGRLAQVVWGTAADNPWLCAARDVVARHLPTETAADPKTVPFAMTDEAEMRARMEAAGFADIAARRIDARLLVGRDIEDAVAFQLALGPAGDLFRAAGAQAEELRSEIEAALAKLFEEVIAREGGLWMDSTSWLITARNPG